MFLGVCSGISKQDAYIGTRHQAILGSRRILAQRTRQLMDDRHNRGIQGGQPPGEDQPGYALHCHGDNQVAV